MALLQICLSVRISVRTSRFICRVVGLKCKCGYQFRSSGLLEKKITFVDQKTKTKRVKAFYAIKPIKMIR